MSGKNDVDVLVVGGGIHGCGVAQAAAAAGYTVVMLEQKQLAAGTSSRSSKLIHGGLRYLESGQIRLVYESLRERKLLLRLAPGLVHPVRFYIPVYTDTARPAWLIGAGLTLYALLAGITPLARFSRVSRRQWVDLDGLTRIGLRAVFRYWDAQTDDAELTRAVWRSAETCGATLVCPAELLSGEVGAKSVTVRYHHNNVEHEFRAGLLVNAAGPWVNQVLSCLVPRPSQLPIELVQGTHIVLPGHLERGIYYTEAVDQRAVFVMPWHGKTLVGTTESVFTGNPDDVKPLPEEIDYLLKVYQRYFPDRDTTVLDSFAGLRVLPAGEGRAFGRSRETVLHTDRNSAPRVLSIYGGKLTGYRATAEKVLRYIVPILGKRPDGVSTRNLPLPTVNRASQDTS